MQIGKTGTAESHICKAYPDRVEVRGHLLLARGLLDEASEVGDALGRGEAADGAHGLLAVRGINPRTDGVGYNETGKQNEYGLSELSNGLELLTRIGVEEMTTL